MTVPTGALSSAYLSGNGSTRLKSGTGWLHYACINTKGVTGNTLTLHDNRSASGTILAVIDTTAQVQTVLYDLTFSTGLTAAVANGTAAEVAITFL